MSADRTESPTVLAIGMVSADHYLRVASLPERDEKVHGARLGWFAGGMAANFAVAARQFCPGTRLVTTFGDDPEAAAIRRRLEALGIDLRGSAEAAGRGSLTAVTTIDHRAEKSMVILDSGLPLPDVEWCVSEAAGGDWDVVYPVALDAAWCGEIGVAARKAGALVAFDLEPYFVASAWDTPDFVRMMESAGVVFMKMDSVRAAGLSGAAAAAEALQRLGAGVVVVTDGPGVTYCTDGDTRCTATPPAVTVADSTGAGDAFAGAFCALYAQRRPLPECLATATAVGSLATTEYGCQTYAPLRPAPFRRLLSEVTVRQVR
ncbi:carbohydrate kinase family protein [Dactylosporangium sp. NPDC050588]|uniref:carbohydrate kinase family protein n=1 Tax=Dactylosporangium sp. NPDC050588 TaxID=3157211 RepID=UPI0033F0ACFA